MIEIKEVTSVRKLTFSLSYKGFPSGTSELPVRQPFSDSLSEENTPSPQRHPRESRFISEIRFPRNRLKQRGKRLQLIPLIEKCKSYYPLTGLPFCYLNKYLLLISYTPNE